MPLCLFLFAHNAFRRKSFLVITQLQEQFSNRAFKTKVVEMVCTRVPEVIRRKMSRPFTLFVFNGPKDETDQHPVMKYTYCRPGVEFLCEESRAGVLPPTGEADVGIPKALQVLASDHECRNFAVYSKDTDLTLLAALALSQEQHDETPGDHLLATSRITVFYRLDPSLACAKEACDINKLVSFLEQSFPAPAMFPMAPVQRVLVFIVACALGGLDFTSAVSGLNHKFIFEHIGTVLEFLHPRCVPYSSFSFSVCVLLSSCRCGVQRAHHLR